MSPPPVPPAPSSDEEPARAYALPGRRTSLGAGESASPAPSTVSPVRRGEKAVHTHGHNNPYFVSVSPAGPC
jgi:hypothetical protein